MNKCLLALVAILPISFAGFADTPQANLGTDNRAQSETYTASRASVASTPATPAPAATATPATSAAKPTVASAYGSASESIDGEWVFVSVGSEKITGDERPTLYFDLGKKLLYGNNGCNTINAQLKMGKNNSLRLDKIATTMMYCGDAAPYEHRINQRLYEVRYYKIARRGNEYYLDLLNSNKQTVIVLRRHNMDFLNGNWQVTALNGNQLTDSPLTISIDIEARHLHGNTGCNICNGEIFIDPDKPNSMQFIGIGVTMRRCPDMTLQNEFLVALEEVECAFYETDKSVILQDSRGNELLRLLRL